MRITSSIEYATRLMVTLAGAHGADPVPAEKLAESNGIPADYVSQILVKLRRAGLINSQRGSAGGYSLSRAPSEVTLGQVVRAVDVVVFDDVCGRYDAGDKDCRHQTACAISPVWRRLGTLVTQYFESVTLLTLLEEKGEACGAEPAWLEKLAPKPR